MALGTPYAFGPSNPGPMLNATAKPAAPKPAAAPKPMAQISPQQAWQQAGNAYAPQQQLINATGQNILAGLGLSGAQMGNQINYANQQYATGQAGIGLDYQNIDAQRLGVDVDRQYANTNYGLQLASNQSDRDYANRDNQIAGQLFSVLSGENRLQGTLYDRQLAAQLNALGFRTNQAQGQAANDTQALGEQVGAMGAYGSRGAGQRQGFIGSTLANTLGGLNTDRTLARVGHGLNRSNLREGQAQNQSTFSNTQNTNQRRLRGANNADKRATADINHTLNQLGVSDRQLDIAAARLGISSQQLLDSLNNAINSASLGYATDTLSASQQQAQNRANQGNLYHQQGQAAAGILGAQP